MAMHRWRGYDHPELHRMINGGPGPAASTPQTDYWDGLAKELADIDATLNAKLNDLKATWQGGAADSAQGGLTPLQQWAADAQSGATGMRASTEYQADIVGRARAEMPEPVAVTTPKPSGWDMVAAGAALLTGNGGPAAAVAAQAGDHEAQEAAQDAASQKAVDTMESYSDSSEFNRNTLGTFVPPPDVVISTPPPSGGTEYSASTFSAGFNNAHTNTTTTPSGLGQHHTPTVGNQHYVVPTGDTGGTHKPQPVNPPTTKPAGFDQTGQNTTKPNSYTPLKPPAVGELPRTNLVQPTPGTPPSSGQFGGNLPLSGPFGGGGEGRPGNLGLRGGLDDAGRRGALGAAGLEGESRQAGRGGAGAPGEFGGRNAGGNTGRGGAGAPGTGGRGGAQGEEDEEYQLADYLVETDDVFGDDRMVSPTVIGETDQK